MPEIFSGLRVVDLSTVLAGPGVGMFFAELGASVVKIENPRTWGDMTRHWKLAAEDPSSPLSAYFASINYRKSYKWLDLTQAEDRNQLLELICGADILLSNFKLGDAEKFGLTDEVLFAQNPLLIHGKIIGFSGTPDRVAFDVVLQAETGFMGMNGTPESGPVKMPVALIDVLAGHQLKEGILCALIQRDRTQCGQVITVSLEESGIASLANQASNFLMTGAIAKPSGSLHPNIAPYGESFICGHEKVIVLAVGSDRQFSALCEILGVPELADDPRFSTNPQRVIHRSELATLLKHLFTAKDASAWMEALNARQVPAGIVKNMSEVFENPVAKRMIREEEIENTPTRRVTGIAFNISPFKPEV